ncbi:3-isopropylmalate dehydratase small subunit, partial [Leptospira sp. SA-E8]|uniref:3-isopropylmalate dehydratase small subunit n=1 Tax=Leptospira sp. SA-E8 TaxID=3422259 RepID=UPI003EB8288B
SGLAQGLFYDLRFDKSGARKPDFVLNQARYDQSSLLLSGSNFGCGSSREHAVWGLLDYGIRAIIAPSFAEIFYSNAMGNQLLLVALSVVQVEQLMQLVERDPSTGITIDVQALEVRCADLPAMKFSISKRHQEMFLQGVDVIGMSMTYKSEIVAFAHAHWARQPWLKDVAVRMKSQLADKA